MYGVGDLFSRFVVDVDDNFLFFYSIFHSFYFHSTQTYLILYLDTRVAWHDADLTTQHTGATSATQKKNR